MKIIGIVNKLTYETLGVYVCEGPFMTKSKPKLKQGPWAQLLWFEGTGIGLP